MHHVIRRGWPCFVALLLACTLSMSTPCAAQNKKNVQPKQATPESLIAQGNKHYFGEGVKQDYKKALEFYYQAADLGSAEAERYIGYMHDQGQGVKQDYKKAFDWYIRAADKGDKEATYNIGNMYDYGQGVKQDFAQAIKWYKKAILMGHINAMRYYGLLHVDGLGMDKDLVAGWYWLSQAEALGCQKCPEDRKKLEAQMTRQQILQAEELQEEYPDPLEMLAAAPEQPSAPIAPPPSQKPSSKLPWASKGDAPPAAKADVPPASQQSPPAKAPVKTMKKADLEALVKQADALYLGEGVAKDFAKAAELYRQAADAGHEKAAWMLGSMYQEGQGVPQDYAKAMELFQTLAPSSNAMALNSIGFLHLNGLGVPQNTPEAIKYFKRAAEKREAMAMYNIGLAYNLGHGIAKDPVQAYMWFFLASLQGDEPATQELMKLAESMSQEDRDKGDALAKDWLAKHP